MSNPESVGITFTQAYVVEFALILENAQVLHRFLNAHVTVQPGRLE
jgi:hypothetical protein